VLPPAPTMLLLGSRLVGLVGLTNPHSNRSEKSCCNSPVEYVYVRIITRTADVKVMLSWCDNVTL